MEINELDASGVSSVKILVLNTLEKLKQEAFRNRLRVSPSSEKLKDKLFQVIDNQYNEYINGRKLTKKDALAFMKEGFELKGESRFKAEYQSTMTSLIKQLNLLRKQYAWLVIKPIIEPMLYLSTAKINTNENE